ncbi:Phosphate:acyl-ACP acyltransferase PlsX (EC 2.3.1.n2) [hydrothermal vent metagenome]|uniref:phosphate acyltransferase n=1 Tax=hydrothermal vent metagenome TaxID=652676 RepID=A0A3B0T3Y3_9ZZZZ
MTRALTVAIDAMGGDNEGDFVIPGAELALLRHPEARILLFGDERTIAQRLEGNPRVAAASKIVHCEVAVAMDEKPSRALRRGRRVSSMWLSLESVRDGEADFAISAGNTGALMAMARFVLKTMPRIDRPAMAALWPTVKGESIILDVGATIGADARQLVNFAVMGAAMASSIFGLRRPRVGLLNIGVEEVKGLEEVREAGRMLRAGDLPLEYHGFIEGNDVGQGVVDVVVTEGFSGNIAIKTAEGTARQIAEWLKAAMGRSLWSRIGFLLAASAFKVLRQKMDPRRSNGGVFLGLNGIVIKSHGGTDAQGFASAIDLGIDMARNTLIARIAADIEKFEAMAAEAGPKEIDPKDGAGAARLKAANS